MLPGRSQLMLALVDFGSHTSSETPYLCRDHPAVRHLAEAWVQHSLKLYGTANCHVCATSGSVHNAYNPLHHTGQL